MLNKLYELNVPTGFRLFYDSDGIIYIVAESKLFNTSNFQTLLSSLEDFAVVYKPTLPLKEQLDFVSGLEEVSL